MGNNITIKFKYENEIYERTCEPGFPDISEGPSNCNFKCNSFRSKDLKKVIEVKEAIAID